MYKPFGWSIKLGFSDDNYEDKYLLEINGVKYEDMPEAPPRQRAAIARTSLLMNMDGPQK